MSGQNNGLEAELTDFMNYYRSRVINGLQNIDSQIIDELSDKVAQQIQSGDGRIFAFGNGGSEAIVEHFIYSLERRIRDGFQFDTYSNPKLSELTDVDNAHLFDQRIKRSGRKGNLAFLVTASGNSNNVNTASSLCREKGIETIAISRNGRIANDPETKADYSVIIGEEDDQQILEDITLILLHLVVDIADKKLAGERIDEDRIGDSKREYTQKLERGYGSLETAYLQQIILDTIEAYRNGRTVRIDGPDFGGNAVNAYHIAHNFKWDGLSDIRFEDRPKNRVYSGIPSYHFTGVGNDGGDKFNYAIEVGDNGEKGDVQIVFARDLGSKQISSLIRATESNGVTVYTFCFDLGDEFAETDIMQMAGHTMGRMLNTYLLLEEGTILPEQFSRQLKKDLALLRQKENTREILERDYGG